MSIEHWELASYVVTVFGLPYAIWIFRLEKMRELEAEEDEIYQKLSDEYSSFLKLLLSNSDLRLISGSLPDRAMTEDQRERKKIVFEILIAIFERAFIVVYSEKMTERTKRLWSSWEDYIRFWCSRADFTDALPELLRGEDPQFVEYMRYIEGLVKAENPSPTSARNR